jgi:cytochrome c biogenesis protein CcmG/thiol:disulfide interchange protein DsbE
VSTEVAPRKKRIAPYIAAAVGVVVVAFLVVLAMSSPSESTVSSSPLLGQPAPEVKSTTVEDEPFDLARRRGSWVVFNFFNSTCVPCRQEHPYLLSFYDNQTTASTPAELYTIVNDDDEQAVRDFFDKSGGGWPIIRDEDANISVDYGVAQVPETWLISPTGVVAQRFTGQVTAELLGSAIATMTQGSGL